MATQVNKAIDYDILEKMAYGVRLDAAKALAEHKRAGRSIAICQNGKIIDVSPKKIEIPEEFKDIVDK